MVKDSSSPEIQTISFPTLNVSTDVCGDNYGQCVFIHDPEVDGGGGAIAVVGLALGESIGIVTFDREDVNQLDFRQKHVVSIAGIQQSVELIRGCQFKLIKRSSLQPPISTLDLVGLCQTPQNRLFRIFVTIDLINITQSHPPSFLNRWCMITNPSSLVYFVSPSFENGVLVYADEGAVYFQTRSDSCQIFENLCSSIEYFVDISPTQQAAYCSEVTAIVDVNTNGPLLLERSESGLPFFCSIDIYCSYSNNSLTLRQRDSNTAILPPVSFPYGDDVVKPGVCIFLDDQFFTVVRLLNGTVVSANLNQSEVVVLGESTLPPRVFGESVQLTTATGTVVRNLLSTPFRDKIDGEALPGGVINGMGAVITTTTAITSESVTSMGPVTTEPLTTASTESLTTEPHTTERQAEGNTGMIAGAVVGCLLATVGSIIICIG